MDDVTSDRPAAENPPPTDGRSDGTGADSAVLRRLAALEARVDELVERTGQEVRTRRLVVVEEDGFERVVLTSDGEHGEVTVTARGGENGATAVELYAYDAWDGDGANVGLALVDQGDITGSFDVFEGRVPRLTVS